MALGIGIEYDTVGWKICLSENGQLVECQVFEQPASALVYIERLCAMYPEPLIALTTPWEMPFLLANELVNWSAVDGYPVSRFLTRQVDFLTMVQTMSKVSSQTYCLPSLKYLQSLPTHRRFYRTDLGTSDRLAQVAFLLYRLREQEASWTEMNFFFLEASQSFWHVTVIKDGRIVDGMVPGTVFRGESGPLEAAEQAYWEELTRVLAGLREVHQLEDIVLAGEKSEAVMNRYEPFYQFYAFPSPSPEHDDFIVAHGAALLAEGLDSHSLAAELVAWLGIREARIDGGKSQASSAS